MIYDLRFTIFDLRFKDSFFENMKMAFDKFVTDIIVDMFRFFNHSFFFTFQSSFILNLGRIAMSIAF